MPTIFSHVAFVTIAGRAFAKERTSFWVLAAFCSIAPDFDVVAFVFRIPYAHMFGHRGITHSITFAIFLGALSAFVARRLLKSELSFGFNFIFFSTATFSHTFFDMMTDGGLGVALFAPFSGARFFLPWRPVEVSPIGADFFSYRGIAVILSEFIWVWIPAILIYVIKRLLSKS
jgi:inner membrane protein